MFHGYVSLPECNSEKYLNYGVKLPKEKGQMIASAQPIFGHAPDLSCKSVILVRLIQVMLRWYFPFGIPKGKKRSPLQKIRCPCGALFPTKFNAYQGGMISLYIYIYIIRVYHIHICMAPFLLNFSKATSPNYVFCHGPPKKTSCAESTPTHPPTPHLRPLPMQRHEVLNMWMFPKIGGKTTPKWMVYFMENPIKLGWFWRFSHILYIFGNTHVV